jgi:hypothetical protein
MSYGQEYDVKKDVILRDKAPWAKLSGKIGMLKATNVMVSSLNGDSLISVKQWRYPSGNPFFDFLDGYEIRFVGSGKTVIKPCEMTLTKEQMVNWVLAGKNYAGKWEITFPQSLIADNKIDPAAEAAFIEKFDKTADVEWAKEYEKAEKELLTKIFPIQKMNDQSLVVKYTEGSASALGSTAVYEVYQGNHFATVEKKYTNIGYTYTILHKLSQPVQVAGREVDTIVVASYKADAFAQLYVNAEGKSREVPVKNPAAAEKELVLYLISISRL